MKKTKEIKTKAKKEEPQLSEREIKLRKLAEEVRKIFKKHNVKPFDRREIYGTY